MKVLDIVTRISRDLIDVGFVRWSKAELIDYMNDAFAAVLLRRPDLSRVTVTVVDHAEGLVTLPVDAYQLLSVNHIDDLAVEYVEINQLNRFYPGWRTETGIPSTWTKNSDDFCSYWIYPAPTNPVKIEHSYSKHLVVVEADDFPLPDIYLDLIIDFILYKAFSKDAENTSEANKAAMHLKAFTTAIADKTAVDASKIQAQKN